MKRKTLLIACLFGLGSVQALAVSKLPPQIPVHAGSGRVTLDLRPLLAETNDVEITRVSVCRRVGSHCQETLWRIELPPGWRAGEIEVFGDYPAPACSCAGRSACSQMGATTHSFISTSVAVGTGKRFPALPSNSAWPANLATGCCSTKRPAWHDATPRSGKERSHER